MNRFVQKTVRRGYNEHYRKMSSTIPVLCELNWIQSRFKKETDKDSKGAFSQRQSNDRSNKDLLLSSFHLVQELENKILEKNQVPQMVINIACFLISKQGRCYLNGLQPDPITDDEFDRKTRILVDYYQDALQGANSLEFVQYFAQAVMLLQDYLITQRAKEIVEATPSVSSNSSLFTWILTNLDFRRRDSSVFTMAYPIGDVNNMTFRLLTLKLYPQNAAFSDRLYELAHRGFVHTCKRDEIKCIRCEKISDQLEENCDLTSDGFHLNGCPNMREARFPFRLASFENSSSLLAIEATRLAQNGLYLVGNHLKVKCFSCSKETSTQDISHFHHPECAFTPEIVDDQVQVFQESLNHLQRKLCPCCKIRPANVLTIKCCHFVLCSYCLRARDQPLAYCPSCQNAIEDCRVLY